MEERNRKAEISLATTYPLNQTKQLPDYDYYDEGALQNNAAYTPLSHRCGIGTQRRKVRYC